MTVFMEMNGAFVTDTNSDFLIRISWQHNVVDVRYIKLAKVCKDIGIRKFEFVKKTKLI